MTRTNDRVAGIRAEVETVTPGEWYVEVDGWPVRWIDDEGYVPVWVSEIDKSENNPYSPYKISFPTLTFIAQSRSNTLYLLGEIERLRSALQEMERWSNAYPKDIFPEPDWDAVYAALMRDGITLDAVSAGVIRPFARQVSKNARRALKGEDDDTSAARVAESND